MVTLPVMWRQILCYVSSIQWYVSKVDGPTLLQIHQKQTRLLQFRSHRPTRLHNDATAVCPECHEETPLQHVHNAAETWDESQQKTSHNWWHERDALVADLIQSRIQMVFADAFGHIFRSLAFLKHKVSPSSTTCQTWVSDPQKQIFYTVCRTRIKLSERVFSCAGPTAWNKLPVRLYLTADMKLFKRNLK